MTYLAQSQPNICDVSPGVILAPLREDADLESAIDKLTVSLAPFTPAALPQEHETPPRDMPLCFPGQLAAKYTARLRAMMPIFISQLYAMFAGGIMQRGAISRLHEVRRTLLALYKAEKDNFARCLVRAVQADPIWQARILSELGGEAALQRWEARRDRLSAAPRANSARPAPSTRAANAKPSRRKPAGLFRLAPLTMPAKPSARPPIAAHLRLPCICIPFRRLKNIPLIPSQLRPKPARDDQSPVCAKYLFRLWNDMQAEHFDWNYLIIMADLMTVSPKVRAELAPP